MRSRPGRSVRSVRFLMGPPLAVAAIAGGVAWCAVRGASADEPARLSLVFEAAKGCPTRERFERELAYRTSKLVVDESGGEQSRLDVQIVERRGRFAGRLVLTLDGAREERAVDGARCDTVVAALSLAAAVLVDPAARTDPLPANLPAPEEAGVDEDAGADADAQPEAEPVPDAAPEPEAGPVDAALPPPAPAVTAARTVWSAEIAGGATTAIDGVDPFASLGLELRRSSGGRPRWAARLSVFASPGGESSAAPGTISYEGYGARLDLCPFTIPLGRALRADACAFGAAWLLPVRSPTAAVEEAQTRLLWTPGALTQVGLGQGSFSLFLDLGLGVHVDAQRFRIEPQGEVFRLPRVYGLGGLGIGATIP